MKIFEKHPESKGGARKACSEEHFQGEPCNVSAPEMFLGYLDQCLGHEAIGSFDNVVVLLFLSKTLNVRMNLTFNPSVFVYFSVFFSIFSSEIFVFSQQSSMSGEVDKQRSEKRSVMGSPTFSPKTAGGFVELQRDRDATAEQWHQVMVVEGCRSALSNWHQVGVLGFWGFVAWPFSVC